MRTKMYEFPADWDTVTILSFLQRRVIVHSILYYEFDANVISDVQYDTIARQLESTMKGATEEERESSRYWYCMNDFSSATGHDLYSRLTDSDREYLKHIADIVLDDYRHKRGL